MTDEALRVVRAANYAAQLHVEQRRKGMAAEPYINHLLEVAALVADAGSDVDVVVAALLHDSIEDTGLSEDALREMWGTQVLELVLEVTDDKRLDKEERKRLQIVSAPRKSYGAQLIKIADKISNLRAIAASPPADWTDERKLQYHDWAEQVVGGLTTPEPSLLRTFRQVVMQFRESYNSRHSSEQAIQAD